MRGCDGDEISRGEGGGDRDVVAMLMLRGLVHKVSMSGPAVIPGAQCLTFGKEILGSLISLASSNIFRFMWTGWINLGAVSQSDKLGH